MRIQGLQKLTLLDYPDRTACTVFLGGCNLRCPFCHNASLVLPERFGASISHDELFSFLESRRSKIEGVCVSGGEPTVWRELPDFISEIKKMGFLIKLDTNGTNPEMLEHLIRERLIDYVAMDIKSSRESYAKTVGIDNFSTDGVEKSAALLMSGKIDFEFRTTVVKGLHTAKDMRSVGEWLRGGEKFFLQSFEDSGDLIENGLESYSRAEMESLLKILCDFIPLAQIRN